MSKSTPESQTWFGILLQGLRESPGIFFAPVGAIIRWLDRLQGRLSRPSIPIGEDEEKPHSGFTWVEMDDRERTVWSMVYAIRWNDPGEAVRRADLALHGLRLTRLREVGDISPELEIGPNSANLSYGEFVRWYPVALKLATRRASAFEPPDEPACRLAFERYRRSQSDFY